MNAETRLLPPEKMIQEAGCGVIKLWNPRPGTQAEDGWKMRSK